MDGSNSIKVLILDDSADDAEMQCDALRAESIAFTSRRVDTREDFVAALAEFNPDVVLADYKLPSFDGESALRLARRTHPEIPVVMVTGTLGEEKAVDLLKLGAKDYVFKDRLVRLGPAVTRALAEEMGVRTRKAAEQAVQISEKRFRSLFQNMLEGFAHCRMIAGSDGLPDFVYLEVNPAFTRLTGLDDVVGKKLGDVIFGLRETNPEMFETYARVAAGGEPERIDIHVRQLDIWLSVFAYSAANDSFIAVFDNITERKRAEIILRESRERLALATQSARIGIWDWDVVANRLDWDAQMYELYGIREQDFSGAYDAWQAGLHPDDRERGDAAIAAAIAGARDFNIEFRVLWPNGEVHHIEAHAVVQRAGDGTATRMIGVNWDITERKRAEAALRRSLEATIDAVAATVESRDPYTAGHQRRVADLAAAIAREMDLPAHTVEGLHFGALIHDLGKVQIPAEILAKPTRLTALEFELMKTHAQAGYDIIKGIAFPWPVADMVHQHHERLDGSGYPQGLKGDAILLEARILAVADVVEAMSSHRPYRPSVGIVPALGEIEAKRGVCFDAQAVDACLRLFREKGFAFEKS